MSHVPIEIQRKIVQQWKEAGPALAAVKLEELRALKHDPVAIDDLLTLGTAMGTIVRATSGLVEMQRIFMKAHPKADGPQ
jgi:hypothetical protein